MNEFQHRISNARKAFNSENYEYGFRSFVDCVLDTEDSNRYKQCIALVKKREEEQMDEVHFAKEVLLILDELETTSLTQQQKSGNVLLKAEDITRSYGSDKFKLNQISLEIRSGEIIGLVGENGNGKTTLLRILAKELEHDFGKIDFFMEDQNQYDSRTQLIYIPQRTPVWYGSLYDNLKFTAANYGMTGEMNQLMTDMMIIRFGLWNYRNLNWSELSSGYKMRFELARTFLRRPKILLLDEPLGNLDVKSQQIILEDLRGLAKSPTHPIGIVLSSQQLFEVEKSADKVIFLHQGEMKHVVDKNIQQESETTIIEIETDASIEQLSALFSDVEDVKISYNGSIYTIEIARSNSFKEAFLRIANADFEFTYIRNISHSTRRFFI